MKQRMKLVGYCRVSTENQKEEGTIRVQVDALWDFTKSYGHDLVEIFKDDGLSGDLEARPALSEMLDYLEVNKEVDGVLIFKLDRLARDLYIQEHFIKKLDELGKSLHSIKEPDLAGNDPMRKAFRQFLGIVSELEKNFITMRLSGGRIAKAKRGGYAGGGPPFGYTSKNKELVIDPESSDVVRDIFHMKRYKRMSLREIAKVLNNKGIKPKKGDTWYASTIRYILKNPIYKGQIEYSGTKSKCPHVAII